MNLIVCVKYAVDEAELRLDTSGRVNLQASPGKLSTFDKNAVEEALRVKEVKGGSVSILSLGPQDAKKAVKDALAMGADKGYLIIVDPNHQDALSTSFFLAAAIRQIGQFDLVFCSEGSSDIYTGSVPPMLAEWLSLPYLGYVKKLVVSEGAVKGEEALEDEVRVVETTMPCVVSVLSEINEPRYPTLLQIMQASKKPIQEISTESLEDASNPEPKVQVSRLAAQSMSRKGIIFQGSTEESSKKLVDALRSEGVLQS
jgi:electron transfer flavoprotein beta subunit